ncbi:MAG: TonB-dependent receptor [Bacteroidota bacterium]|nr:TonB-dependent receptor [Bacteroidota bacterium]
MRKIKYLCLFFVLLVSLNYPQQTSESFKITLSAVNEPLERFLKDIYRKTNVTFVYSDDVIQNLKVSCKFNGISLNNALEEILTPLNLDFKYSNEKQIVIYRSSEKKYYNLEGLVVDQNTGEPLPYVVLSANASLINSVTNSEGRFFLQKLPSPNIELSLKRIGYQNKTITINTLLYKTHKVIITLTESVINYNPILVESEAYDIFHISNDASRLSFSSQNYSLLPVIGDRDISRALQLMPGINTSNFGSSGLNIRSGIPTQNLLLLDGIVLYHMNHSFGFFSSFNPDIVKDVNVYKGGFPAKYGGRVAGIIEYSSKSGDVNNTHITLGANQLSFKGTAEIPLFGKGSVLLSARRSFSDYILGSLYDRIFNSFQQNIALYEPERQQRNSEDEKHNNYFYDLFGKVTFIPTDNNIVSISCFTGKDRSETNGTSRDASIGFGENSQVKNDGISFRWFRQWDPRAFSVFLFSSSNYSTNNNKLWQNKVPADTFFINRLSTANLLNDNSFRLDNVWDVDPSHRIETGISYTKVSTSFNFEMEYVPAYDVHLRNKFQNDKKGLTSFYLQDIWKISSKLIPTVGVRFDKYEPSANVDFEPRLSVNYLLSERITLKGALGKYYQYIMQLDDFSNILQGRISWIAANGSDVKPSSAEHYILGAKYELNDFLLDVELYYKKLYNVLESLQEWSLSERNYQSLAIQNDANAKGIDIILRKKVGAFSGWISYSYSKAKSKYYVDNHEKQCPSSTDCPHKLDLAASLNLGDFILSATWRYFSGKPYSVPAVGIMEGTDMKYLYKPEEFNNYRFPGSHQMDISLSYIYSDSFIKANGGISVFNVYDRKNIWYRFINLKNNNLLITDVFMLGVTPTLFIEVQF